MPDIDLAPIATRPGWKTSEFWISLVATVVGGLLASGILPDNHPAVQIIGAIAAAVSPTAYTTGRAMVKKAAI